MVMDVARLNSLSRVQRCGQIMGRSDAGDMSSAQIFYPCMQVSSGQREFFMRRGGGVDWKEGGGEGAPSRGNKC